MHYSTYPRYIKCFSGKCSYILNAFLKVFTCTCLRLEEAVVLASKKATVIFKAWHFFIIEQNCSILKNITFAKCWRESPALWHCLPGWPFLNEQLCLLLNIFGKAIYMNIFSSVVVSMKNNKSLFCCIYRPFSFPSPSVSSSLSNVWRPSSVSPPIRNRCCVVLEWNKNQM